MARTGVDQSFVEAASATMRSLYGAIEHRDLAQLQEILAPEVLVLTPESDGVLATAAATTAHLGAWLDASPQRPLRMQSTELRLGTSEDGLGAWASDQLLVDLGRGSPMRLRVTAALSWNGTRWRITAGHCSIPLPNDQARALIEAGRLRPGVALSNAVHGDAQPLVELLDACLVNPQRFSEACSTSAETVAFGSAAEEVFYGPQVKQAWEEFIGYGPRMQRRGGVAARVSEHGGLGWVATQIDISFDITRPYRFFIIYARAHGRWEMVSIHDSLSSDLSPGELLQ
jgi:ketosteroid isomerase-like protein